MTHLHALLTFSGLSVPLLIQTLMCTFEFISAFLATFRCIQAIRIGGFPRNQGNKFLYLIFDQGVQPNMLDSAVNSRIMYRHIVFFVSLTMCTVDSHSKLISSTVTLLTIASLVLNLVTTSPTVLVHGH